MLQVILIQLITVLKLVVLEEQVEQRLETEGMEQTMPMVADVVRMEQLVLQAQHPHQLKAAVVVAAAALVVKKMVLVVPVVLVVVLFQVPQLLVVLVVLKVLMEPMVELD